MTQISKATFNTTWADAAGSFAANTTRDIGADDVQQFAEDIKDSALFVLENPTLVALEGLATGSNKVPYSTGTDTFGQLDFKDEDDMASDSVTALPSQQSVKAYYDLARFNNRVASYTLVLTDIGKVIEMSVGSANDLTVPLNASVAFPTGTQIHIVQYGAGQTSIVATGGVTIRSDAGRLKIANRYCGVTLMKIAADEWYLIGALTA